MAPRKTVSFALVDVTDPRRQAIQEESPQHRIR